MDDHVSTSQEPVTVDDSSSELPITRHRQPPQRFANETWRAADTNRMDASASRNGNLCHSATTVLAARALHEMRIVAGSISSDRLLVPSKKNEVTRLDMWLTQNSYLNGEWVWILRPAEPVKVGTLMRTMPPLNHDPTTPFCPEFGKIYSLEGHVAEIEFENSRRRFDLTTQSVSTLPSMILCKITGVRRSSLHRQVVADVTGGTITSKKIVPTHEMKISAILTARPTITGRSWSFLGFQKPEGGQEIFDPQLGQLVASRRNESR